ncbi:MAG: hypothetical protein PHF40_00105 [Candidatus Pacebacteria bacterium]|nr:hypothetical protein [Candidatus Paceibacterota bacterium]
MDYSCFIDREVFRTGNVAESLPETDVIIGSHSEIFPPTHLDGEIRIGIYNSVWGSFLQGVSTLAECRIYYAQIFDSQLGNDVKVENALIKDSKLGDKTYVGPGASLNRVIAENEVKIPHVVYLSDLKIGAQTNVAAGVITCNFDGVEKHASAVGKKCFLGVGVHLIAPCLLEDEVFVSEGISILPSTRIKKHSLVAGSGKQYKVHENRCFYIQGVGWIITLSSTNPELFQPIQKKIFEWQECLPNQTLFDIKKWFLTTKADLDFQKPIDYLRDPDEKKMEKIIKLIELKIKSSTAS